MFWLFGQEAYGILALQPGIKSTTPALEGKVLTTGPPGKFFPHSVLNKPLVSYLRTFALASLSGWSALLIGTCMLTPSGPCGPHTPTLIREPLPEISLLHLPGFTVCYSGYHHLVQLICLSFTSSFSPQNVSCVQQRVYCF